MTGLLPAFFAFLQAELAADDASTQQSRVQVLFCSRFLAVFTRDVLMRLGLAPPSPLPPLDEAIVRSPTLPWQALEGVAADDMPLLFLLLSRNAVSLDLRLASSHASFPYMLAGDTLYKYVERFPCWWTRKLLAFWRMRSAGQAASAGGSGSGGAETDLRRLARTSQKLMPSRRGSYAIMKRDLEKVREEQEAALLLIVHFSENDRTVNVETTSAKKSRHLVYEIGERYGMDLEAWALKDKAGNFLDDYKSLKQSNVRSGDELTVALKYKALQFKTVTVLVHAVNADGSYAIVRVPADPYTTVEELVRRVARHSGDEVMLPLVVGGKLCGVWLEPVQTIASYGAAEARWLWQDMEVQKPLLLGARATVMRYSVAGAVETDARIAQWWGILEQFGEWTGGQRRRGELHAALAEGVPPCLRFAVWDRALGVSELCAANGGLFEKLADLDLASAEEEAVVEKIERDLDRTMPYHPFFRTRLCKGQTLMLQVLRAFSLYDKEIGYCQVRFRKSRVLSLYFFFSLCLVFSPLTSRAYFAGPKLHLRHAADGDGRGAGLLGRRHSAEPLWSAFELCARHARPSRHALGL